VVGWVDWVSGWLRRSGEWLGWLIALIGERLTGVIKLSSWLIVVIRLSTSGGELDDTHIVQNQPGAALQNMVYTWFT